MRRVVCWEYRAGGYIRGQPNTVDLDLTRHGLCLDVGIVGRERECVSLEVRRSTGIICPAAVRPCSNRRLGPVGGMMLLAAAGDSSVLAKKTGIIDLSDWVPGRIYKSRSVTECVWIRISSLHKPLGGCPAGSKTSTVRN